MSFNTVPNVISDDMNFCPLPKTWYELQVDTTFFRTYRFAKRSDHTGILFKLDMADLYRYQTLSGDS